MKEKDKKIFRESETERGLENLEENNDFKLWTEKRKYEI